MHKGTTPTSEAFAEQMHKKRLRMKLTQKQVGKLVGVSSSMIGLWEKNLRVPDISSAILWAEALGHDFWPIEVY